jgi:hypothetical protein
MGDPNIVVRQAVRAATQAEIDDVTRVTILSSTVSGNTVTARLEVRFNRLSALGVERIVADATVEVSGGKLVSGVVVPDVSDAQTAQFLAAIAPAPPATGNAGLAATGGGVPAWPWQLAVGAAVLALTLFGRLFVRQSAVGRHYPIRPRSHGAHPGRTDILGAPPYLTAAAHRVLAQLCRITWPWRRGASHLSDGPRPQARRE